jgi:MFS family permease
MLGDAVLYAASRATSTAIENVSRRATWTALAAAFLVCGLVFALILAFWLAEPRIGALYAAGAIAVACAGLGLFCLAMPWLIERIETMRKRETSPVATTVAVVDEEAREAVDYFGALQVVGAAFVFGLGAARRLKR